MGRPTYSDNKGRRDRTPPFVALPNEMLDSPAYLAMSPHGTRLLIAFGRQFRGMNNASLYVTFSMAMKYGFTCKRTYYTALDELKRLGFLEMTKPATRRGIATAARYALTWHPIHEPLGDVKHDATPTDKASNDWRNWTPDRGANQPLKSQKARCLLATPGGANQPLKNEKVTEPRCESATHRAVSGDLRGANQPPDLISTNGGDVTAQELGTTDSPRLTLVGGAS